MYLANIGTEKSWYQPTMGGRLLVDNAESWALVERRHEPLLTERRDPLSPLAIAVEPFAVDNLYKRGAGVGCIREWFDCCRAINQAIISAYLYCNILGPRCVRSGSWLELGFLDSHWGCLKRSTPSSDKQLQSRLASSKYNAGEGVEIAVAVWTMCLALISSSSI